MAHKKTQKQTYQHMVLDIETLALSPNAVVASFAVVAFDIKEIEDPLLIPENRVYTKTLTLQDQFDLGRIADESTLCWWMQQSAPARCNAFNPLFARMSAHDAICGLSAFVQQWNIIHCWGNGSGFDNVIMRSLCNDLGLVFPIHYSKDKDLRTLKFIADSPTIDNLGTLLNRQQELTMHVALDDALAEMSLVQRYYRKIFA